MKYLMIMMTAMMTDDNYSFIIGLNNRQSIHFIFIDMKLSRQRLAKEKILFTLNVYIVPS